MVSEYRKKREEQKEEDSGNNYVDKKEFFDEMVVWKKACKDAEDVGEPNPPMPDCIGEKIILIAEGVARMGNFSGYSYKDEMILDGIENCVKYGHNFDPDKSTNPFAYFSTMIYYAFLRRIQAEKKQAHIKKRCIELAIDDPRYKHDLNDMGTSSETLYHIQQKLAGENIDYEKSISKNKSSSSKKKMSSSSSDSLFD